MWISYYYLALHSSRIWVAESIANHPLCRVFQGGMGAYAAKIGDTSVVAYPRALDTAEILLVRTRLNIGISFLDLLGDSL
jgi:hypothetical protein